MLVFVATGRRLGRFKETLTKLFHFTFDRGEQRVVMPEILLGLDKLRLALGQFGFLRDQKVRKLRFFLVTGLDRLPELVLFLEDLSPLLDDLEFLVAEELGFLIVRVDPREDAVAFGFLLLEAVEDSWLAFLPLKQRPRLTRSFQDASSSFWVRAFVSRAAFWEPI